VLTPFGSVDGCVLVRIGDGCVLVRIGAPEAEDEAMGISMNRTVLGRWTVRTPCGSVDGCVLVRTRDGGVSVSNGAPEAEDESVGPPMNREGPPMGISVVVGETAVEAVAEADAGSNATLQQEGVE
jgi:hypothetical protein